MGSSNGMGNTKLSCSSKSSYGLSCCLFSQIATEISTLCTHLFLEMYWFFMFVEASKWRCIVWSYQHIIAVNHLRIIFKKILFFQCKLNLWWLVDFPSHSSSPCPTGHTASVLSDEVDLSQSKGSEVSRCRPQPYV